MNETSFSAVRQALNENDTAVVSEQTYGRGEVKALLEQYGYKQIERFGGKNFAVYLYQKQQSSDRP